MAKKPVHYLNLPEFAERLGLHPDTLKKYNLPEPDITLGQRHKGWSEKTIDHWDRNRPRPSARRVPRPEVPATDTDR